VGGVPLNSHEKAQSIWVQISVAHLEIGNKSPPVIFWENLELMGKNTVPDPLQKRPSGCLDWVPSTLGKDFMIDKPQNLKNQSGFHASWDFRIVLLAFLTLVEVSFVPESSVLFSESSEQKSLTTGFSPSKRKGPSFGASEGFEVQPPKKPKDIHSMIQDDPTKTLPS